MRRINSYLFISGSRFEVLVCTTFSVVASSFFLMVCHRSGTLSTIVVTEVAARPEVMVVVANRGLDACSAEFLVKVGDGNLKLGEVLNGNEELCVGGSAVGGEGTIGRSESCDRGSITGSDRRKVGDGFGGFILILMVGRLEDGTGRGGLRLPPLLVGSCKKFLEACPGLVVSCLAPPAFAVVIEEPGLEQDLESNCDDLGRGIGHVFGRGVVHRIFDLIDKGFEILIDVVGSQESRVVVLRSGGGNVCIDGIQMVG